MIKQRRTTFGNGSEIVEEEIDTTAIEVGDKFVMVKKIHSMASKSLR